MVLVVAMDGPHCEVIDAPLLQELLAHEVLVAILLNPIVVETVLDHVAYAFQITPASFNRKCVVEGKLLVDHSERVISPHVIPAKLGQLRDTRVDIAVAHMTVGVDDSAVWDVALHNRDDVVHGLVSDAVGDTDLGLSTEHAKHPAHSDVVA